MPHPDLGGVIPSFTVSELARLFRVHPNTVRYWARRDQWERDGDTFPAKWFYENCRESYVKRRKNATNL